MNYSGLDEDTMRRRWARTIRPEDRLEAEQPRIASRGRLIRTYLEPRVYSGIGMLPIFNLIELVCDGYSINTEAFHTTIGRPNVKMARACMTWGLINGGWSKTGVSRLLDCHPKAALELFDYFAAKAGPEGMKLGGSVAEAVKGVVSNLHEIPPKTISSYKVIAQMVADDVATTHTDQKIRTLMTVSDIAVAGLLFERGWSVKLIAVFRAKSMGQIYELLRTLGRGDEEISEEIVNVVNERIDRLRAKHKIA